MNAADGCMSPRDDLLITSTVDHGEIGAALKLTCRVALTENSWKNTKPAVFFLCVHTSTDGLVLASNTAYAVEQWSCNKL